MRAFIRSGAFGVLALTATGLLSGPACANDRPQTEQTTQTQARPPVRPAQKPVDFSKPLKIEIYDPSDIAKSPGTNVQKSNSQNPGPQGSGPQGSGQTGSGTTATGTQIAAMATGADMEMAKESTSTSVAGVPLSREELAKDIARQITTHDGPVPVIENPTSCGHNAYEIKVDVVGADKDKGRIVADLSDSPETFLVGNKTLLRIWQKPHDGKASFCVPLTGPGEYTLSLYQDKNENLKLDKNFLGIPKERFGMSNNPHFGMKKPKYEEAKFTVTGPRTYFLIKLRKASDILGKQK